MSKLGRPRAVVKIRDPIVRTLLDAVAASPLSDQVILHKSGCDSHALHRLRVGGSARIGTIASLAAVVGLKLRLER